MTSAEEDFLAELTRSQMVQWAALQLEGQPFTPSAQGLTVAREKGWLSKSDPPRVLAKGFSAATAFLKR
jgi:hypothetical protein